MGNGDAGPRRWRRVRKSGREISNGVPLENESTRTCWDENRSKNKTNPTHATTRTFP